MDKGARARANQALLAMYRLGFRQGRASAFLAVTECMEEELDADIEEEGDESPEGGEEGD